MLREGREMVGRREERRVCGNEIGSIREEEVEEWRGRLYLFRSQDTINVMSE